MLFRQRIPHMPRIPWGLCQVDALATSRSNANMHEASRRVLSVLLRKVEGFSPKQRTIVICATNRKRDLDPALLSRFDLAIRFNTPPTKARVAIFRRYAQHLSTTELARCV